ncbi:MAG: PepSY domain-containing protein, partial [Bacteroidales bacterium]|nr:PepSY domain-containing protein [Bacteroidales bacterium]
RLFHAIHVGSWGGIVTKILTFIVCVVGATLPLTGYYIYFKKRLS